MNMQQIQLDASRNKSSIKFVTYIILIIACVGTLFGCLYFGIQVAGALYLGYGMANSDDYVLHSDPNPDNTITIHAISDGCGATCDCTTRLDMEFGQEYKTEIYRISDCDVEIKWLDRYRFEVIDIVGKKTLLDARDFGNVP